MKGSLPELSPAAVASQTQMIGPYFGEVRSRLDGFVAHNFTWPGTFRLHGAAFGWDILRAPVNVMLAPVLLATRLLAHLCRRLGLSGTAEWLFRRRILLRTSVAAKVEVLIVTDLLRLPLDADAIVRDPDTLARAVQAAPQFREMIRKRASAADAETLGRRFVNALGEYTGTRSAVAEMTTALCVLVLGAVVFQKLTPGMISLAPDVANTLARTAAIEAFPLGRSLGRMWYGTFGIGVSPWLTGATVAALVMVGATFAAFAGILADPVQARLGIHRRRLERLVETLEVECFGSGEKPFAAREHYYARILDLWDTVSSALRIFRS